MAGVKNQGPKGRGIKKYLSEMKSEDLLDHFAGYVRSFNKRETEYAREEILRRIGDIKLPIEITETQAKNLLEKGIIEKSDLHQDSYKLHDSLVETFRSLDALKQKCESVISEINSEIDKLKHSA